MHARTVGLVHAIEESCDERSRHPATPNRRPPTSATSPASSRTRRWATGTPDYEPQGHRRPRAVPHHAAGRRRSDRGGRRGRRRIVDRDLDRGLDRPPDRLRAATAPRPTASIRCPARHRPSQYFAYIAYDLDLFEQGSIANLTASIIGNVFGFKPLKALRLEDMRIPGRLPEDLPGPGRPASSSSASASTSSAGRCSARPPSRSSGLSGRNYGRVVYEALKGGLDFIKDDENINSQPFMHWRDRFLYVHGSGQQGVAPRPARSRATTSTSPPARWRRCTSAPSSPRSSARCIVMIDLVIGYTAIQSMANWARQQRHDPAPAPRRPLAPTRGRRTTA